MGDRYLMIEHFDRKADVPRQTIVQCAQKSPKRPSWWRLPSA